MEWSRGDASVIDGQTDRSKWAGAHESIGERPSFNSVVRLLLRKCLKRQNRLVNNKLLSIGAAFPSQLEFETRFRSVRVQRLPLFAQVIAIFKKELEPIDVFRSFFPISDFLEHECDRRRIFSKPFRAQPRLVPIARVQRHQQGMNTIGMINGDKPRIAFQNSVTVSDGFKRCVVRLTVFSEGPRANEPALESFDICIQQVRSMKARQSK